MCMRFEMNVDSIFKKVCGEKDYLFDIKKGRTAASSLNYYGLSI